MLRRRRKIAATRLEMPEHSSNSGYRSTTHPVSRPDLKVHESRQSLPVVCPATILISSDGSEALRYRVEGNAVAYQGVGVQCNRCHGGAKTMRGTAHSGCGMHGLPLEVAFTTQDSASPIRTAMKESASIPSLMSRILSLLKSGNIEEFKRPLSEGPGDYSNRDAMDRLKGDLAGFQSSGALRNPSSRNIKVHTGIEGIYKVPITRPRMTNPPAC